MKSLVAVLLALSFAVAARAGEAPAKETLSGSACIDGDLYYGRENIDMFKKGWLNMIGNTAPAMPELTVKIALQKAGYTVDSVEKGGTGCVNARYSAPGKKAYHIESLSAENPSIEGASCVEAARTAIDNYIQSTRQKFVVSSIKDLGDGKCRFSVYAVRPPADALPNAITPPAGSL